MHARLDWVYLYVINAVVGCCNITVNLGVFSAVVILAVTG